MGLLRSEVSSCLFSHFDACAGVSLLELTRVYVIRRARLMLVDSWPAPPPSERNKEDSFLASSWDGAANRHRCRDTKVKTRDTATIKVGH